MGLARRERRDGGRRKRWRDEENRRDEMEGGDWGYGKDGRDSETGETRGRHGEMSESGDIGERGEMRDRRGGGESGDGEKN